MKRVFVSEALRSLGKKVLLRGWVYRIRKGKNIVFIILRDRSNIIQCAVRSDNPYFNAANALTVESSIHVVGKVKSDKRAVTGAEVEVEKLHVYQNAEKYPITKDKSVEHLMNYRHLWIRSREMTEALKVRAEFFRLSREFFFKRGFLETTCPMFVGSKGESGGDLFEIDYFGKSGYLTQTSQFHLEAQFYSIGNCFVLGPTFRAEKSRTRKHLTEFWMLEIEEDTDLKGLMKTMDELIQYLAQGVGKGCKHELSVLGVNPKNLLKIKAPFHRMKYERAIEFLKKKGFKIQWGEDIGTEAEKILTEDLSKPLHITHWPKECKTFYMPIDPDDERCVLNVDMQAPKGFGELFGGSQRSTDFAETKRRIVAEKDDPKKYKWYLDLMRYGALPHSGFGMGMDRVLAWFLNAEHIRDVVPFPRFINRLKP